MDLTLSIPLQMFSMIVLELRRQPHQVAVGPMGLSSLASGDIDLLPRSFQMVHESVAREANADASARFELALAPFTLDRPGVWPALAHVDRQRGVAAATPTCSIWVGDGPDSGLFTGVVSGLGEYRPLRTLRLVGSGMPRLAAVDFLAQDERMRWGDDGERWSRLIGALGGEQVWLRWTAVRACLVGAGRTGSLVAKTLAHSRVGEVVTIDPDRLESHNLDAMDAVTDADLGRFKADAVVENLRATAPDVSLISVPHSVLGRRARDWIRRSDLLITCVDSDRARLFVGALASAYTKPLLDIGTGVFRSNPAPGAGPAPLSPNEPRSRDLGADIRLVLPGDGCLLCYGGVANPGTALSTFRASQASVPWHERRAGSLRSLNSIAAHSGIRLLEDLVGGVLNRSMWLRYETSGSGQPSLLPLEGVAREGCPMCGLLGLGDALHVVPETPSPRNHVETGPASRD